MGTPLLVAYYHDLPEPWCDDEPTAWAARLQAGLDDFKAKVAARYGEATLHRLLGNPDVDTRRAAVLALGLMGTLASNAALAARLHDADPAVRQLAGDALWSLWFRGSTAANNRELQRLMRLHDPQQMRQGFTALIARAPGFAEAYNQRAILAFRLGDLHRAIADCQRVLQLNPYHFGAQAGLAQCYMKLGKTHAALRAFRQAFRLNPTLDGVAETIRALETVLGEDGPEDRS